MSESELNMLKFQPNFQVIVNLVHSGRRLPSNTRKGMFGLREGEGKGGKGGESLMLLCLV